jgi:hypothetical protein
MLRFFRKVYDVVYVVCCAFVAIWRRMRCDHAQWLSKLDGSNTVECQCLYCDELIVLTREEWCRVIQQSMPE